MGKKKEKVSLPPQTKDALHCRLQLPHSESLFVQFICMTCGIQKPREAIAILLRGEGPFYDPACIRKLRELWKISQGAKPADPNHVQDLQEAAQTILTDVATQRTMQHGKKSNELNSWAFEAWLPDWEALGIKREKSRKPRRRLWSINASERVKTSQRRARLIPVETVLRSLCNYLQEDPKDVVKAMMEDMSFKENEEYVRYAKLPRRECLDGDYGRLYSRTQEQVQKNPRMDRQDRLERQEKPMVYHQHPQQHPGMVVPHIVPGMHPMLNMNNMNMHSHGSGLAVLNFPQ